MRMRERVIKGVRGNEGERERGRNKRRSALIMGKGNVKFLKCIKLESEHYIFLEYLLLCVTLIIMNLKISVFLR